MYSFDSQIASRGLFIVKPHNAKPGHKLKVERETNKSSKSIEPICLCHQDKAPIL